MYTQSRFLNELRAMNMHYLIANPSYHFCKAHSLPLIYKWEQETDAGRLIELLRDKQWISARAINKTLLSSTSPISTLFMFLLFFLNLASLSSVNSSLKYFEADCHNWLCSAILGQAWCFSSVSDIVCGNLVLSRSVWVPFSPCV